MSKEEGVNDCVKFIIKKIKYKQEFLCTAEQEKKVYGGYEDCGSSYHEQLVAQQAKVDVLIEVKISLEKYKTKLKHEHEEKNLQDANEFLKKDEWEEMSKGG